MTRWIILSGEHVMYAEYVHYCTLCIFRYNDMSQAINSVTKFIFRQEVIKS